MESQNAPWYKTVSRWIKRGGIVVLAIAGAALAFVGIPILAQRVKQWRGEELLDGTVERERIRAALKAKKVRDVGAAPENAELRADVSRARAAADADSDLVGLLKRYNREAGDGE